MKRELTIHIDANRVTSRQRVELFERLATDNANSDGANDTATTCTGHKHLEVLATNRDDMKEFGETFSDLGTDARAPHRCPNREARHDDFRECTCCEQCTELCWLDS